MLNSLFVTTKPSTISALLMSEETFSRRLSQLINQIKNHPNAEEILRLAQEQLADDTLVLPAEVS